MRTNQKQKLKGTKRLFFKLGTCSRTMAYILNREFGHLKETHERALDPLAGGIIRQGYQCGMLWGASMSAGAEAYRRCNDLDQAIALAIRATQHIMGSFFRRTATHDCFDITDTDWNKKLSIAKYMLRGKMFNCYRLMDQWAPEAIQAAYEGLDCAKKDLPEKCISCSSEVVRKMGGSEEEMVMVAGFAGGIGLSGNACGALGASIWMKTLALCKETPGKSFYNNPKIENAFEEFYTLTDYEVLCKDITGKRFETIDEHADFIKNGGCDKLIAKLSGNQTG